MDMIEWILLWNDRPSCLLGDTTAGQASKAGDVRVGEKPPSPTLCLQCGSVLYPAPPP